jgi:replication-associated recombination protein RarA
MSVEEQDPWVDVKTYHGYPADHVISALQKEIRRGNVENAVLLANEMLTTGPAMEDYLWYRLMVIAVEDVGFGEPSAPILLNALHQAIKNFDRQVSERKLFAIHAVRYLCGCHKDRSSDEMALWVSRAVASGKAKPAIPDYALDMHTADGQARGRGMRHFFEEGTRLNPELPGRDLTYRRRIMEMLDGGEVG